MKLFENVGENQFKLSEIDVPSDKHEMPTNDTVGQFLTMMTNMEPDKLPDKRTWFIIIGMAEEALIHYKNQRTGTN